MKRIGITQRVERVEARNERRDALDQNWSTLLEACGAIAVPLANRETLAKSYFEDLSLDGVIFSGGNDPGGAPEAKDVAPERDAFEKALFKIGLERGLPMLGVCRGAQVMNLLLGGRLVRLTGHTAIRHEVESDKEHTGCHVAVEFGWPSRFEVNSFHGYGIRSSDLAPSAEVIAWSVQDGTVEAFRLRSRPVVGILWHPERERVLAGWDRALLKQLFGV